MWDYRVHDLGDLPVGVGSSGVGPRRFGGAGLCVGAIRGVDTLVTEGASQRWTWQDGEPAPEFVSYQPIRVISTRKTSDFYDPSAKADQQYIAVYSDTTRLSSGYENTLDEIDQRPHKPIGVEVVQTSYSWSSPVARGFVIVDYQITNITNQPIEGMCIAYYADPDIYDWTEGTIENDTIRNNQFDDIVGLLSVAEGFVPGTLDTIMSVWAADNDGDPSGGVRWGSIASRDAFGVRVLRAPDNTQMAFNWFANDHTALIEWGPRRRSNPAIYGGSQGAPYGRSWSLLYNDQRRSGLRSSVRRPKHGRLRLAAPTIETGHCGQLSRWSRHSIHGVLWSAPRFAPPENRSTSLSRFCSATISIAHTRHISIRPFPESEPWAVSQRLGLSELHRKCTLGQLVL